MKELLFEVYKEENERGVFHVSMPTEGHSNPYVCSFKLYSQALDWVKRTLCDED